MYIVPLLPLLIPLGGMMLVWALPDRADWPRQAQGSPQKPRFGQPKRWIYTAALAGALLAFFILYGVRATGFEYHLWPTGWALVDPMVLAPDALSMGLVSLFVVSLLVISLSMLYRPMERFESVTMLGLVVTGLGTILAGNLLTLAFFWAITDVVLLIMGLVRAPLESIARVTRAILGSVVSALALLGAMVLTILEGGATTFDTLALGPNAVRLIMAAALLRLGVYPLPGSLQRRWEVLLICLCTGGYLWLRLGRLTAMPLPGIEWLVPLVGWLLLLIGLLAFFARDLSAALPLVFSSGIASMVLAGLVGPGIGAPAMVLMTINLAASLALLLVDAQVRAIPPWGRNARLPLLVGLASLAGWPLTLGFAAHWSLFQACWHSGHRIVILQASLGYMLVSVPVWQRLRQIAREIRSAGPLPHWQIALALACAALLGVGLLVLGPGSRLLAPLWAGAADIAPGAAAAASTSSRIAMFVALLATAAIVPFLGSYALQRYWLYGRRARLVSAGAMLGNILELDWLYAEIQSVLGRLAALAEFILMGVEEVFFLGWSLIWILVIILFLV